jgi:hypothetical protein
MNLAPTAWKPEKPQCVHHNDADNCLLCGTKRIKELKPEPYRSSTPIYDFRCAHGNPLPCMFCDWLVENANLQEAQRLQSVQSLNAVAKAIWGEVRQQEHEARWPGGKCEHGHYLATEYCNVCSLRTIEPDYDPNKYRIAITKAMKNMPVGLRRERSYSEHYSDGDVVKKELNDLHRVIDLKIWQACHKYGDRMSEALAYTIAKNAANTFLRGHIDDTTILNGIAWEFMSHEFREQAEELLARLGHDIRKLESAAKNHESKDYALAKQIVEDYGERIPRAESMTPTENEDGEVPEVSRAEAVASLTPIDTAPSAEDFMEAHRPTLEALVATWRGDQRKVGEAMLRPGFKVTGVPGVDKSKVSRIRQVVLKAFRNHLKTKGLQNS